MATVRRAVVIGDASVVTLDDLTGLGEASQRTVAATVRPVPGSDAERTALVEALAGTQENITLTAQELGVSRVTLYRMLRRHSINLSRGLKTPPVAS
jgi:transcriptional regulator of acetoin/glycerol metabolism